VLENRKWADMPQNWTLSFILGCSPHFREGNERFQALTAPNVRHVTPRLALKRLITLNLFLFQASSLRGQLLKAALGHELFYLKAE
jgi:hypothetical protein